MKDNKIKWSLKNEEDTEEVIRIFPAYQKLSDEKKLSVLEGLALWIKDELKKLKK